MLAEFVSRSDSLCGDAHFIADPEHAGPHHVGIDRQAHLPLPGQRLEQPPFDAGTVLVDVDHPATRDPLYAAQHDVADRDVLTDPLLLDERLVGGQQDVRSEENTSELQSLMRISY